MKGNTTIMKKYEAVIFDMDGTLLDSIGDLTDSVNVMMRQYQYPEKTLEEVKGFVGNGIRRLLELVVPEGEKNQNFENIVADFLPYYKAHCQIKTKPYDGIIELLKELHSEGYKMAIVSNKSDPALNVLREEYFNAYIPIAIGEKTGIRKKPAPDTVYQAIEKLGCDIRKSVYIGDSEVDKMTAENAGMDCVMVSWGFRSKMTLQELGATQIADHPLEILELIK